MSCCQIGPIRSALIRLSNTGQGGGGENVGELVKPPAAAFSFAANAPSVVGGASVLAPSAAFGFAARAPVVSISARVDVPAATFALAANAPTIITGASVQVPAAAFALAANAPDVDAGEDTDPHFANVSALLHFDGSDGSTTFVDSSSHGATVTPSGNAQIDTAQSVFGGASGLFDGTGDYLTIADDGRFDFGTGDFTVEMRVRFASTSGTQYLVGGSDSAGSGQFALYKYQFGTIGVGRQAIAIDQQSSTLTWNAGQWYDIAISRTSGTLKIFRDGVQVGSATNTNSYNCSLLAVARSYSGVYLNGWMDELRITKGVGRYTGSYTPATAAFPDA